MKYAVLLAFLICAREASSQTLRIDSMFVDENQGQLLLFGDFGPEVGLVYIQDSAMKTLVWTPWWVRCKLPASGTTSAGNVYLETTTTKGPSRKLSVVKFTLFYRFGSSESGTAHYEYYYGDETITIRLRGELAHFRTKTAGGLQPKTASGSIGSGSMTGHGEGYTPGWPNPTNYLTYNSWGSGYFSIDSQIIGSGAGAALATVKPLASHKQ